MRSLVFCTTCKFSAEDKSGPDGRSGGEMLIGEVEKLLAERGPKRRAHYTAELPVVVHAALQCVVP